MKNPIMLFLILTFIICISFLSGCSTIMNTSGKFATINSNPSGAKIIINGRDTGRVTPANIEILKIDRNNYIKLEKEEYESIEYVLSSKISPWVFGNLLFVYGLPFGILIDILSDSIYKLEPNMINVELRKK